MFVAIKCMFKAALRGSRFRIHSLQTLKGHLETAFSANSLVKEVATAKSASFVILIEIDGWLEMRRPLLSTSV